MRRAFLSFFFLSAVSAQTLYLAGDSPMAVGGGQSGATQGWGAPLTQFLTIPVVNEAVAGESPFLLAIKGYSPNLSLR
ncbi:hypothetical protein DFH07DRAFT_851477 [Mycena maculata]|uniref:Uncharacterized protein n=1 Tax=Mycena maculata TaxID=230809 RepID=A0AAD7HTG0_9AGAR|nr:hypothetical protein DFH07DRAFT_851477 [Mycena maculata]